MIFCFLITHFVGHCTQMCLARAQLQKLDMFDTVLSLYL